MWQMHNPHSNTVPGHTNSQGTGHNYMVMVHIGMAYIVMAHIAMAHIAMAYSIMAYTACEARGVTRTGCKRRRSVVFRAHGSPAAYTVLAYIVMACYGL